VPCIERITGLEPATLTLATSCSSQLSYIRMCTASPKTGSNRPPLPYRGSALPNELSGHELRSGSWTRTNTAATKEPRPAFRRSRIAASRLTVSNRRPAPYKGAALPAELRRHSPGYPPGPGRLETTAHEVCLSPTPPGSSTFHPAYPARVRGGIRTLTPLAGYQHLKLARLPFRHKDMVTLVPSAGLCALAPLDQARITIVVTASYPSRRGDPA
jgi:hypothetical protein